MSHARTLSVADLTVDLHGSAERIVREEVNAVVQLRSEFSAFWVEINRYIGRLFHGRQR